MNPQRVILDAAIDRSVIRGTLTTATGERRELHGWLELNTALEALAAWCLALLALPALHADQLTRTGAPLITYIGALAALLALAGLGVTRNRRRRSRAGRGSRASRAWPVRLIVAAIGVDGWPWVS